MPHLDDGQLAELLDTGADDAHVAACAACRARLDDARSTRARARAILRSTTAAAPPPFAEVLHRAGRRPRRLPLRAVAWAATLVLAAGIGWQVGRREQPAIEEVPLTAPGIAAAVPPEAPAAPPPAEPVRARAEERSAAASGAGAPAAGDLLAQPRVEAMRRDTRLRVATPVPAVPAPAVAEAGRAADDWRMVTLAEAELLLGGDVQSVEGLATLGHAVRVVRGGVEVRTEQALPQGSVLELLQRKAELDAEDAGPRVRRGPFVITGRAAIPLDSLRALLLRLQ